MFAVIVCNVCAVVMLSGLLAGIVAGMVAARASIAAALAFDAYAGPNRRPAAPAGRALPA